MRQLFGELYKLPLNEIEAILTNELLKVNYVKNYWPTLVIPGFYRVRKHSTLIGESGKKPFLFEKEFWNPEIEFVTRYGRCNDIGQSVFYCSNRWETAIAEVKPQKKEDFLSVATFELIDKQTLLKITPIGVQYLSQIDDLQRNNMFGNYQFPLNNEMKILDDDLDDLFHSVVSEGQEEFYKPSIALTNCLMKKIGSDGLMYSSIVRDKQSYNFMLTPESAKKNYQIKIIQTFEIIELSKREITVRLVRQGIPWSEYYDCKGIYKAVYWNLVNNGETSTIPLDIQGQD